MTLEHGCPPRQESASSFQRRDSAYDQLPAWLQRLEGLVGNAKRLYGLLTSAQRTGWQPTYVEIAAELRVSARSVIRWVQQLVTAGLIAVKRRGQGMPNVLTVLARVTSEDDSQPQAAVKVWQTSTRSPFKKEAGRKKPVYTSQVIQEGACPACGARGHRSTECPLYAHLLNRH